jgi:transcriptional regulator with XRE-family HTH domain
MPGVTNRPFSEELPRLLTERGLSVRSLARQIDINSSHLSRVIRRKDYKTPSSDLMRRISEALGLPDDYFPEYRELVVIDRVKRDAALRDEIYAHLPRKMP